MSNQGDLPKGWVIARIEEIGDTSTGGTPSRRRIDYFGGEVPWLKSGELEDGIIYNTEEKITAVGLEESAAKWFPPGAICIALYGATVGKLAILGIPATTNQAICGIFLPPDIDTKYVFRYLESIRRDLIGQGRGGAQSNISNAIIRQTLVPLAPVPEQRRIVAKIEELFSDLDAGVAALERAKAKLKRYRAAVLKAAVEGRLTEQWRAENPCNEPASKLLERILKQRRKKWEQDQLAAYEAKGKQPPKDWQDKYQKPAGPDTTNLPKLPEGWCWASLEALADIVGGITKDKKRETEPGVREVPYLRVANVQRGFLDLSEIKTIAAPDEAIANLMLQEGDILFTEGGDRDKLGRGWVWSGELNECIHQNHIFRARLFTNEIQPKFVSHHGNTFGKEWFIRAGKQTTNLASINMGILRRFPIAVPPASEQHEILLRLDEKLTQIDAADQAINNGLARATRLRQSILMRPFEGKLVPQDPTDEPASVLLERIKTAAVGTGTFMGSRESAGNPRRRAAATKETELSH